jgi:hypothetical protein
MRNENEKNLSLKILEAQVEYPNKASSKVRTTCISKQELFGPSTTA